MEKIKKTNVSGRFYPSNPNELASDISSYLTQNSNFHQLPKAIIAPHAGYIYSGPTAGFAYKLLKENKDKIKKVCVLSPSHYYRFSGVALGDFDYYETPLGKIPIAKKFNENIVKLFPFLEILPEAFEKEHALEVHLPFLQEVLGSFELLPLIVGPSEPEDLAKIFSYLENEGFFFVISSDLSHFHPYNEACAIDEKTCQMVEEKNYHYLSGDRMCGVYPVRGLLKWAEDENFKIKRLDLSNSGDTAGDHSSVVGYGSFAIY